LTFYATHGPPSPFPRESMRDSDEEKLSYWQASLGDPERAHPSIGAACACNMCAPSGINLCARPKVCSM